MERAPSFPSPSFRLRRRDGKTSQTDDTARGFTVTQVYLYKDNCEGNYNMTITRRTRPRVAKITVRQNIAEMKIYSEEKDSAVDNGAMGSLAHVREMLPVTTHHARTDGRTDGGAMRAK